MLRIVEYPTAELMANLVVKKDDPEKWLQAQLKLQTILHDMLLHLHKLIEGDDVSQLETLGIMNTGMTTYVVRCWAASRSSRVFFSWSRAIEFPVHIGQIDRLWDLLKIMFWASLIVRQVRDAILEGAVPNNSRFQQFLASKFFE